MTNLAGEVRKSLTALALRNGKPDPHLVRVLDESQPSLRATAAEALIQGGGEQGRSAVRKLLKDKVPDVRLRVALAFALAKEREGIPVLIDLLPVLSAEEVGQVEDTLNQLAGDSAPEVFAGTEPAEKKKCRDAWAAWWKLNADRVDLGRLTRRAWLGYTLICDMGAGRVFEIDRDGKERWAITNLRGPVDAVVVPGKRVLIAEYHGRRVTERDFTGKILWSKQVAMPPSTCSVCAMAIPSSPAERSDHGGGPRRQGGLHDQQPNRHQRRLPIASRRHRLPDAAQSVHLGGYDGQASQEFRL